MRLLQLGDLTKSYNNTLPEASLFVRLQQRQDCAPPLKPEDIVRPTIGVKLSLATRPSILAEESCVT